jgi:hypothetical protein
VYVRMYEKKRGEKQGWKDERGRGRGEGGGK